MNYTWIIWFKVGKEMRVYKKRKERGISWGFPAGLSRGKCYTGWCIWAWQQSPDPPTPPFPSPLSFLFAFSPHLLLSICNRLVLIPFCCRLGSWSSQPYLTSAHTRSHLTRLHSPLSLTYTQPHSLREGRAIISLQLARPPSLPLFLRTQNMSSTHKSDGLGLQTLDLNWTHLWNPQSARNENKGPATR